MSVSSQTIKRSLETIRKLEPSTRTKVADTVAAILAQLGIPMLVYGGKRSYAEQWEKRLNYLEGGPKAAAPGYSWHNFARAVDMVPILPSGKADWNSPMWSQIITIAKSYGLESGKSFGDTNHFANKAGASLAALRAAKPVPEEYQRLDKPGVPKEIEANSFKIPRWLPWTVAGAASLGLLAYLLTSEYD